MPWVSVVSYMTKQGRRFRVIYRLGGRETPPLHGGSFKTKREALARKLWISGELAALRVPDLRRVADTPAAPTLAEAAARWQASRVDVSPATATYHRSALRRARPLLNKRLDQITANDIAALVGSLAEAGKSRETIRKTVTVLAMIFDHAGVTPNPARDRIRVRLPREERREIAPPTAEHVEAVYGLLAPDYRLPLLVLDATGMRVGELVALTCPRSGATAARFSRSTEGTAWVQQRRDAS
jgi:hypothetical protein